MSTLPRPLLDQHLNEIFDCIWDEDTLAAADFTKLRFQLANYAFSTGHPTGFLIKSLIAPPEDALNYALRAEEMGCTHPRLNVRIGMLYFQGYQKNKKVIGQDLHKALPYFEKGVGDGCVLALDRLFGYFYLSDNPSPLKQHYWNRGKAIRFLEDNISQGYTEGKLAWRIGKYHEEAGTDRTKLIRDAYKRAIDMGRSKAALHYVKFPSQGASQDNTQALLIMTASLGKPRVSIVMTYLSILHLLMEPSCNPPYHVTRLYKDKVCMALSYSDALINMGYPEGYMFKGGVYDRFCHNKKKAHEVWREADARGVASFATYASLGFDRKYTPQNGWQLLLYCQKGLDVARDRDKKMFFDVMADIYNRGIPPIAKNPVKAIELEEKAKCYPNVESGSQHRGF